MKRHLFLASISAICIVVTITLAIFAQAQPTTPTSPNVVTLSNGGHVILQLPQGNLSHPVNLRISVAEIDKSSDFGGPDVMQIYLWVPTMNTYVPVAILSTNTNESAITWIKNVVNGTPAWTPPAMPNYFVPTPSQLQVSREGPATVANLTTSVNVTLPAVLGGNFTIPPMTLMFIPIAEPFAHNETIVVPSSNWTINTTRMDVPAWVRVSIPTWLGGTPIEAVGTLTQDVTSTYIPPKP